MTLPFGAASTILPGAPSCAALMLPRSSWLLDERTDLWFVIHRYSKVVDRWTSCVDTAGNWLLEIVFVFCLATPVMASSSSPSIPSSSSSPPQFGLRATKEVPAMAIRRSINHADALRVGDARDGRRLRIGGAESAPLSAFCVS